MGKKIAVISSYAFIVKNANYGAILQYYALQKHLKKRGHDAFWIRFIISKDNLKKRIKDYIKKSISKYEKENAKRRKLFLKFADTYLNLSPQKYYGNTEIQNNPPIADFYITGSDQVWAGTLPANFLTFVKDDTKKISYAASFGGDTLSDYNLKTIKPWLKSFNSISVRESSGINICKQLDIDNAIQVVDPTMLLKKEEYPKKTPKEKLFTFGYLINLKNQSSFTWDKIYDYTHSCNNKLIISTAQGSESFVPDEHLVYPTIEEWLGYYNAASSIITNTFHGTVFAIIFQKPFVVILQKGGSESQNCRFHSLLKLFELENRIWDMETPLENTMNQPINWNKISHKIEHLINQSDTYFSSSNL